MNTRCAPSILTTLGVCLVACALIVLTVNPVGAQQFGGSQWPKTNFDKRSVELDEIMSGGPPKDGIPAIDEPRFVDYAQADEWVDAQEPVIALSLEGEAKAYPLQILIWHEIVNDKIGSVPVSVTFCPLCNSCVVFDRRVAGRVLDFGTTGRLRKSDMVMYDRQTESWWQQLIGKGIVGELTGQVLTTVPADIVSYQDFKTAFPSGKVLSRETGHIRQYGANPYRGYDSITDRPFLFYDDVDPRLPPMERVININVAGKEKIYPFGAFARTPIINDQVNGMEIVVFSRPGTHSALDSPSIAEGRLVSSATAYQRTLDGKTLTFALEGAKIVDHETGSQWDLFGQAINGPLSGKRLQPVPSGIHFAFAWLAFNPKTEIYAQTDK